MFSLPCCALYWPVTYDSTHAEVNCFRFELPSYFLRTRCATSSMMSGWNTKASRLSSLGICCFSTILVSVTVFVRSCRKPHFSPAPSRFGHLIAKLKWWLCITHSRVVIVCSKADGNISWIYVRKDGFRWIYANDYVMRFRSFSRKRNINILVTVTVTNKIPIYWRYIFVWLIGCVVLQKQKSCLSW